MNARLLTALLACAMMLCTCNKNSDSCKMEVEPVSREQIRQLVDQLYSDNDDEAQAAAKKLEAIGKPAVGELVEALEDEDGEYWPPEPILDVLAAIGPDAEAALPALLSGHSLSPEIIRTIAAIGPRDKHLPMLIKWLSQWVYYIDDDDELSEYKKMVANFTGDSVNRLMEFVQKNDEYDPLDKDVKNREAALLILKWLPLEKPSIHSIQKALLKSAGSEASVVRETAIELLGRVEQPSDDILQAICNALNDDNSGVRYTAVEAIDAMVLRGYISLADRIGMLRKVEYYHKEDLVLKMGEKAVPELIKLLDDDSLRTDAAGLLSELGPKALPAVPSLITALGDKDSEFVCAALYAISKTGDTSESTVNAVMHATASQNKNIRKAALSALGDIGGSFQPSLAILKDAVNNTDPEIQIDAIYSLARAAPDSEEVAAIVASKIDNEKITVSSDAANAINRMTIDNSRLTAYLLPVLDSKYVHARLNAIEVLNNRCEPSPELATALCGMFDDDDTQVMENAATLAGKLGEVAVPELKKALVDNDRNRRIYAAWAIACMGKQASSTADELIQMLSDKDESIAEWAMVALCEAGVKNGRQVDELRALLGSDDANRRRLAVRAMACAENITDAIIDDVISMTHDKNERVSVTALTMLASFADRPHVSVNALVRHLKTDKDLRYTIADILEKHAWKPTSDVDRAYYYAGRQDVLPLAAMDNVPEGLLAETIKDMNWYAWSRVQQALKTTQPDDRFVACVAELLPDADEDKRLDAAETLGLCGKNAAAAKPQLIEALNDKSAKVKRTAMSSLVAIDPSCEEAIAVCLEWIKDKDANVRLFAAETLGKIAELTPHIKAALEKATKDENLNVQSAAIRSLDVLKSHQDNGDK